MMEIADEVSESLKITFEGQPIDDLTKFTFILHNSGFSALDKESIVSALKWTGPGTVLAARSIATDPPVELDINHSDKHVEIRWSLFNQHCKALIEVLCAHGPGPDRGTISGQIRNVPRIDTKEISYFDEEQARKQIRANIAHWPQFMWFLTVLSNRRVRAIMYFVMYCYFAFLVVLLTMVLIEDEQWIEAIVVDLTFAAIVCVASVRHLIRNRYSRLIRKGKRSATRNSDRPPPQEDRDTEPITVGERIRRLLDNRIVRSDRRNP